MRKKYVEHIVNVASEVRNKMNLYATEQAEALSREAEEEANKEFRTLAENLHHLVGTKAIRGIYNPAPHLMAEPTAQAIPIEEHLRGVVKDLLRTTGRITHKGLIEDVNGTKKIPYKGLYNKLSIQASAPYDTVKRAEQNAKILHKISCVDPKNEYVTCRKPYRAPEKSNNEGDPFLDKWANPFFVKGVPKNEQQLKESIRQRKALFALPTDPYHNWHAGTSGNKSAAYPNDIFDIMGDATMTGGTAHRHMGRTDRFGLASSSDNRGMRGSTLPNPPLRDTKVLYGDNGIYLRNTSTTSISKHTITVSGGNTSRNKSSISDRSGSPSLKQSSKVR